MMSNLGMQKSVALPRGAVAFSSRRQGRASGVRVEASSVLIANTKGGGHGESTLT